MKSYNLKAIIFKFFYQIWSSIILLIGIIFIIINNIKIAKNTKNNAHNPIWNITNKILLHQFCFIQEINKPNDAKTIIHIPNPNPTPLKTFIKYSFNLKNWATVAILNANKIAIPSNAKITETEIKKNFAQP